MLVCKKMSNITDAWQTLYDAQTEAIGFELTANVYGIDVACIASAGTMNNILAPGGVTEDGGYELQMLASNFSPGRDLKLNADGDIPNSITIQGVTLEVIQENDNNGIKYCTCGRFVAKE